MPLTTIRVYRDRKGDVPLKEWLDSLEEAEPRAYRKCLQRIVLLADKGSDLRRPHADKLRDGICELRARVGNVNYRILYFFCGQNMACLSHGITKEAKVPADEIDKALVRKNLVKQNLDRFTGEWEI